MVGREVAARICKCHNPILQTRPKGAASRIVLGFQEALWHCEMAGLKKGKPNLRG
jgi:hypothetical protein